jgi:Uma2 family endonuclease
MSVATLPPRSSQSSEQPREEAWPGWLVPPEEGYFAEDLDRLPGLPPHTELLNGSLVFVSPQASWHDLVIFELRTAIKQQLPEEWRVRGQFTVRLGPRDRPEPDVLVVAAAAVKNDETTWVGPRDVRLVVEVESPESRIRVREIKFAKYAEAGIPNYWRIRRDFEDRSLPVTHLYELAESGRYEEIAVQSGHISASIPFSLSIDLTDLD